MPLHVGAYLGISKNTHAAPEMQHKPLTNHRQELEPSDLETKAHDLREKQQGDVKQTLKSHSEFLK